MTARARYAALACAILHVAFTLEEPEGDEGEEEEEEEHKWWLPVTYPARRQWGTELGEWWQQLALIVVIFGPLTYLWHYFGRPSALRSKVCNF